MNKKLLFFFFALFALMLSAQGDLGIVGPAANGWPDDSNPTPDIMLTNNGDGTHFIAALTLNTGDAKFRTDKDWGNPNYGADAFPTGNINDSNINVVAGVYDILVDLNNQVITFTDVATFTDIEMFGTGVLDGSTPQMATTDGENYSLTVTQLTAGNLQFREVGTSTTYGSEDFPGGTATLSGPSIISESGFYKVAFNLSTGVYSFDFPSVGIVGPGANGWPDNGPTDIAMNTTDGDTYTLDDQVLSDGDVKFRQDQAWNVNWGGSSFPGGNAEPNGSNNIAATAGTYDIVFSRSDLTYAFNTTLSNQNVSFDQFKVYPNPSSESWFFDNSAVAIKDIKIFDNAGKMVYETTPNTLRVEVKSNVFKQGFYIAQVSLTDGAQTSVKIIKL